MLAQTSNNAFPFSAKETSVVSLSGGGSIMSDLPALPRTQDHPQRRLSLARPRTHPLSSSSPIKPAAVAKLPPAPIPLPPSHIVRTKSELQLAEDMHAAEWRDQCMFQRLVTGIRQRQEALLARHHQAQQQQQQQQLHGRGKIRVSLGGHGSASVAPLPPPPPAATASENNNKVLVVSPYPQSPGLAAQRSRVTSRQHLQDVLYKASGLADDALAMSSTKDDCDWSLGGYEEEERYEEPSVQEPRPLLVPTPHQSYLLGPLPAPHACVVEEEAPEDDDDEDGGIFSLDM